MSTKGIAKKYMNLMVVLFDPIIIRFGADL